MPRLIWLDLTNEGLGYIGRTVTMAKRLHIGGLRKPRGVSMTIIMLYIVAQALLTAAVVGSLYANYLNPEYRAAASQLSAFITGFVTVLLFVVIGSQPSEMTDDVVSGRVRQPMFRRTITWLSLSRAGRILLSQALLLSAALLVAYIAGVI